MHHRGLTNREILEERAEEIREELRALEARIAELPMRECKECHMDAPEHKFGCSRRPGQGFALTATPINRLDYARRGEHFCFVACRDSQAGLHCRCNPPSCPRCGAPRALPEKGCRDVFHGAYLEIFLDDRSIR